MFSECGNNCRCGKQCTNKRCATPPHPNRLCEAAPVQSVLTSSHNRLFAYYSALLDAFTCVPALLCCCRLVTPLPTSPLSVGQFTRPLHRFQRRAWCTSIKRAPTPGKGYGIFATGTIPKVGSSQAHHPHSRLRLLFAYSFCLLFVSCLFLARIVSACMFLTSTASTRATIIFPHAPHALIRPGRIYHGIHWRSHDDVCVHGARAHGI